MLDFEKIAQDAYQDEMSKVSESMFDDRYEDELAETDDIGTMGALARMLGGATVGAAAGGGIGYKLFKNRTPKARSAMGALALVGALTGLTGGAVAGAVRAHKMTDAHIENHNNKSFRDAYNDSDEIDREIDRFHKRHNVYSRYHNSEMLEGKERRIAKHLGFVS